MSKASLNHTYRVVWNDARNMWVAVAETAKTQGKGGQVKPVAVAVAVALEFLSGGSAHAAGPTCNGGSAIASAFTVSGAETGPCQLGNGGSLSVTSGGSVSATGPIYAITGTGISTSGGIVNAGTLSSSSGGVIEIKNSTVNGSMSNSGTITANNGNGIWLNSSTMTGGVTNTAGGTISSSNHGIMLHHSTISGIISNAGTLSATGGAIHLNAHEGNSGGAFNQAAPGSTVGGISNTGTIHGNSTGINIATNSTVSGSITNSGTISGTKYTGIYLNHSAINGGIVNSGTISGPYNGIHLKNSATINGGITNSAGGSITANGAGGASYIRGISLRTNTTVNGGINNAGTISASAAGGEGIFVRSSTVNGGISNSGTISGAAYGIHVFRTGAGAGAVNGGITNSGTISGGTYAIYADTASTIDSISITGADTAKFVGSVYAPNTPVTVASGATYTMQGGEVFTLNGTSPGFTVSGTGTLGVVAGGVGTITGNYIQDASATFRTYVTNNTTYGKLSIGSGTATIASGAKIDVRLATPTALAAGDTLQDVIHTAAAVNLMQTTFGVTDNSLGLNFMAVNDGAGNIDVTVSSSGMTTIQAAVAGNSPAAIGAAGVLDTILTNGTTDPTIQALLTAITSSNNSAQVATTVNQALPLLTGGGQVAAETVIADINRIVQARIDSNRGLSSGDNFYGDKRFWMKPFGSWVDQHDRRGVSGYSARTGGLAVGIDGTVSDATRLGGSFAYARANVTGNSTTAPNNAGVDVFNLVGYGSHALDQNTELNFQVGIGVNHNQGDRQITAAGATAHATYNSLTATFGAGVGRTYKLDSQTAFMPSIRADYAWIKDESYTETGAGALNLKVDGQTTDELIIAADGKFMREYKPGTTLTANLGVGYDALNKPASITAAFAGAPTVAFVTKGIEPSPWLVRGGLGIVGTTESGMEISARYDAEYRQDFLNQTLSAKLRWVF